MSPGNDNAVVAVAGDLVCVKGHWVVQKMVIHLRSAPGNFQLLVAIGDVQREAGGEGVADHEVAEVHLRGPLLRGAVSPRGSCHAEEHQRQEQDVFCKCLHVVIVF